MQLFSWRIGQAIAYAGGRIVSTNTDGLYSVLDSELNNKILAHEAESINVQIDPEPMYLISKDTNNRIEMDPENGNICGASGGSLACRKGPSVTKSLTHPAAIDWALTEYLIVAALHYKNLSLSAPFDDETGMNILKSMSGKFEPIHLLRMFQNVIASSVGSVNYIFGTTDSNPGKPIIMQHYNRVFIMKDGTPDTVHLHSANARVITAAQQQKRRKDNERAQQHDPLAVQVLAANGVTLSSIPSNKEAVVKKVTNIEDTWYMYICNKDLHFLSDEEINFILTNLDYDKYLGILRDSFENNWRNHMPKGYVDPATIQTESVTDDNAEPANAMSDNTDSKNNSAPEAPEKTTVVSESDMPSDTISEQSIGTKPQSSEQYAAETEQLSEQYAAETKQSSEPIVPQSDESPVDTTTQITEETPTEPTASAETTADTPSTEPDFETKPDDSQSTDPLNIMSLLDDTDIQRIMDTAKIALTSLDNSHATFTFRTEDPEIVQRLCKMLY